MKYTYNNVKKNHKTLTSMTGLKEFEFQELAIYFKKARKKYLKEYTFEGKKRIRTAPVARENSVFTCENDMLLFILIHFKLYHLQEIMAFDFEMDQAHINRWIKHLTKVLFIALDDMKFLPSRCSEKVKYLLTGHEDVFHDGTEIEIMRPGESEAQREFYSGKKNSTPSSITLFAHAIRK